MIKRLLRFPCNDSMFIFLFNINIKLSIAYYLIFDV